MPKIGFTTNQLELMIKTVRDAMPKAKKAMAYSLVSGMTDFRELGNIEDKLTASSNSMMRAEGSK